MILKSHKSQYRHAIGRILTIWILFIRSGISHTLATSAKTSVWPLDANFSFLSAACHRLYQTMGMWCIFFSCVSRDFCAHICVWVWWACWQPLYNEGGGAKSFNSTFSPISFFMLMRVHTIHSYSLRTHNIYLKVNYAHTLTNGYKWIWRYFLPSVTSVGEHGQACTRDEYAVSSGKGRRRCHCRRRRHRSPTTTIQQCQQFFGGGGK